MWVDREYGVYRIGDEHGDFIDDWVHPIERYANPPLKDGTVEKRAWRNSKKKEEEANG